MTDFRIPVPDSSRPPGPGEALKECMQAIRCAHSDYESAQVYADPQPERDAPEHCRPTGGAKRIDAPTGPVAAPAPQLTGWMAATALVDA